MAEPVLELRGVTKDFGAAVVTHVLRGVTAQIHSGEMVALVGPSGSGKSTLLHIMGLLARPTTGQVVVAGQATTALADPDLTLLRGRALGFVFQFHHLLPAFTALENVMLPMFAATGRLGASTRERAEELLARVDLSAHQHKRASDLSGGQQQRVAIARALVRNPPLVLADEPTGNLDTQNADRVFALLREFNREQGTAFLVVTHDPRMAARCDRRIELMDGRVVGDSPTLPGD